jgi:hypothetical protein
MSHEARAVTIPCERLDDRLRHWPRIDFVKIDVEGAELLVLKGGREVLTKWRPRLLLECTVEGTKRFGYGPSDVYDLLTAELGYRVFLVADWLWSSGPIDRALFCGASAYPPLARNFLAERVDG